MHQNKPLPWDADRAKQIWNQMTPEQQVLALAQADRMIWAALCIRLDASGKGFSSGQNWKVITGGGGNRKVA